MIDEIKKFVRDTDFYYRLFGKSPDIIESKKRNLEAAVHLFEKRFGKRAAHENASLISVPNRVEILGKHTDYQGGETLLLTGPKNFFAIASPADDGLTELVNADPSMGTTVLRVNVNDPVITVKGVGSHYTSRVVKRLSKNLLDAGFPSLKEVKSVFIGDVPFGGGTSGSSSKVITDFSIFASVSGLLMNREFISLIIENGRKAGLRTNQQGVDDFLLALSMYLAHYENGLDFGDLKGDRGVGTFGGSEDHTAIVLGKKGKLLYCRYCPTEVLESIDIGSQYSVIVAFSGKRAEKTKEAMTKYNRLSLLASSAVNALNEIHGTHFSLLRDFYKELPSGQKAHAAYKHLLEYTKEKALAERACQFFKERDILRRAVACLKDDNIHEFGNLINESHDLSRKYLKNIVPEIDYLQKCANSLGALGATGFGAGFGGSCYAVVTSTCCADFMKQWEKEYTKKFPQFRDHAQFDVYPACSGCCWEVWNVEQKETD